MQSRCEKQPFSQISTYIKVIMNTLTMKPYYNCTSMCKLRMRRAGRISAFLGYVNSITSPSLTLYLCTYSNVNIIELPNKCNSTCSPMHT